jgi:hypothetical protein
MISESYAPSRIVISWMVVKSHLISSSMNLLQVDSIKDVGKLLA